MYKMIVQPKILKKLCKSKDDEIKKFGEDIKHALITDSEIVLSDEKKEQEVLEEIEELNEKLKNKIAFIIDIEFRYGPDFYEYGIMDIKDYKRLKKYMAEGNYIHCGEVAKHTPICAYEEDITFDDSDTAVHMYSDNCKIYFDKDWIFELANDF